MYTVEAALSHLPSVFIIESGRQHRAAVVAAPVRKLWPAYLQASIPVCCSTARIADTKHSRVRKRLFVNQKKGPFSGPLCTMEARIAETGHKSPFVLPKYTVTPFLKGSIFEALILTYK